jgi:hypothetical protein
MVVSLAIRTIDEWATVVNTSDPNAIKIALTLQNVIFLRFHASVNCGEHFCETRKAVASGGIPWIAGWVVEEIGHQSKLSKKTVIWGNIAG